MAVLGAISGPRAVWLQVAFGGGLTGVLWFINASQNYCGKLRLSGKGKSKKVKGKKEGMSRLFFPFFLLLFPYS